MPVEQNIQKFYKTAQNRDFSRDFLFRVTQMELQGVPALGNDDLVYVKTASIPGRTIQNVPVQYMGLDFNIPGSVKYPGSEGYALTFYLDGQGSLRNYFEKASRSLFDDKFSTGNYGTPGFEYHITLEQLDKDLTPVVNGAYRLVGASIRNIGAITYDIAGGTGNVVSVETTIAYQYYTVLQ